MKLVVTYEPTQQQEVTQAIQRQAKGHFYSPTRTYVITTNDNRIHELTLNFLDRIVKFFTELGGKNYFENLVKFFAGKKVTVLSSLKAGLPVRPGSTELPSAPTSSFSDTDAARILQWGMTGSIDIATIKKNAKKVEEALEKKIKLPPGDPARPYERSIRFEDAAPMQVTEIEEAANYLVLIGKIGYCRESRGNVIVSTDPNLTREPSPNEMARNVNKDDLLKIDTYITTHKKELKDLEPVVPGLDQAVVTQFLASIVGSLRHEALDGPQVYQLDTHSTTNPRKYLDFLCKKGVIKAFSSSSKGDFISFEDPAKIQKPSTARAAKIWETANSQKWNT